MSSDALLSHDDQAVHNDPTMNICTPIHLHKHAITDLNNVRIIMQYAMSHRWSQQRPLQCEYELLKLHQAVNMMFEPKL